MNRIEIDVYSDFVCPWCFIGSRRLQGALESFGRSDVVTRHHPYLLYPNVPVDGIDLRASLGAAIPSRIPSGCSNRSKQQDARPAFRSSSPESRACIRQSMHTRSFGTRNGRAPVARSPKEFSLPIFWRGGISPTEASWWTSLSVMASRRLEAHGLLENIGERRRTQDEAERATKSGVRGVPLYVINGRETVSGAQVPSVFRGAIERALAAVA